MLNHESTPKRYFKPWGIRKDFIGKRPWKWYVPGLMVVTLIFGCTPPPSTTVRGGAGPDIATAQQAQYNGPKARIAVADFEDKMKRNRFYANEYGSGMKDMLATALFNTNRYVVLERDHVDMVLEEQDFGASGRVKQETASATGEIEGAELLVVAAVTGFDPAVSKAGAGLGSAFGILGDLAAGVAGGFSQASIAIDVRIVDARTSRVVAATSVESKASKFSGGSVLSGVATGVGLGGFAKTPMEQAIRDAIEKMVQFLVSKTPAQYYHQSNAKPAAPQPAIANLSSGSPVSGNTLQPISDQSLSPETANGNRPASALDSRDMEGSQDHPKIPRIKDTYIVGYAQSPFDEGTFITSMHNRKLGKAIIEGVRTKLAYLGPKTLSPLMVLRTYQSALTKLGETKEVFSCRKDDCYSNFPDIFIWSNQHRVDNILPKSNYAFGNSHYYRDQRYWYGTVTGTAARYHVSVYSTVFSEGTQAESLVGQPFIFLEILEEADFKPAL